MKTIIKILILILAIPLAMQAQDQQSEVMFTTIYLQPELGKEGQFRQGLKAHNEKFHTKAPHQTDVFVVHNGPRAGEYVWLMGPHTYADKDLKHPEGHGPDWGQNVSANSSAFGPRETWKRQENYVKAGGASSYPIVQVRFLEINIDDRQGYRMFRLYQQLTDAIKSLGGDFNWAIYENEFQQGKQGRHFAIVSDYPNWETVGKASGSRVSRINRQVFDKVHGDGAFQRWNNEWSEVFVDSYDEYWVRQAGL